MSARDEAGTVKLSAFAADKLNSRGALRLGELQKTCPESERRSGRNRRKHRAFPPLFSSYRNRRTKGRRKTDKGGYVDVYDFRSWGVAFSVLILSLADAVLTGMQINAGRVQEANPMMNVLFRLGGIYSFVGLKAAMTSLPLAILVLHKEWALARYAARLCLWSYILVSAYHIYLIAGQHSLDKLVPRIA